MPAAGHIQRAIIDRRRRAQLGDYTPLPYPPRGGCSGSSGSKVDTGIGIAAKSAMAVAPFTGPAAPFVLLGAGIAQLFSSLVFGGHAKKVATESQILCGAVPAANQALDAIYQAVKSGQVSPQDGAAQLDQLVVQFATAVQPIAKGTFGSSQCNGACLYKGWLAKAVQQQKADFGNLQPQATLNAGAGGPAGVPWWGWALGAAAAAAVLI